ncbi:MAG: class I SAM-dependent methyltransferase [Flavobacterium sp. JAD_PAG50586_2]|nr:MAG: class I SAM-dependent methyltransferase [Flavobacterium sp. JAD_PAG50586_2]
MMTNQNFKSSRRREIISSGIDEIKDVILGSMEWGLLGTFKRMRISYIRHRYLLWSTEASYDFDRKYGIDTTRKLRTSFFQMPKEVMQDAVMYWATPVSMFYEIMSVLNIDFKKYIFVDFGCGKGRVVLLASHYPFQKIFGLDIHKSLLRIGVNNFQKFQSQASVKSDVQFMHCSATDFRYTMGKNYLIYLFNPFGVATFCSVLDRLEYVTCAHSCQEPYVVLLDPTVSQLELIRRRLWILVNCREVAPNNGQFSWYVYRGNFDGCK